MDLPSFNSADPDEVASAVHACNAAASFAPAVVSGRPYESVDALVTRAGEVTRALPWADVEQALAAHPRIGDRVSGESAEAASSRREQSTMDTAADPVRAGLLQGNREYEARFDHVFLVRAAGRTPEEMLAELRRRLVHTPDQERPEVLEQLAQITELRIRELVS